jgi:hypothetical protein
MVKIMAKNETQGAMLPRRQHHQFYKFFSDYSGRNCGLQTIYETVSANDPNLSPLHRREGLAGGEVQSLR